jgi:FAD/FMN-containing dehydrogenase
MMPLDLGAKGSCQIGGNLSTNAGGIKFIKYNSMHANCLGLEIALADGTVISNINRTRKDNTAYDLKHLFIGAEGTLGMITGCSIVCPPLPTNKQVCLVASNDFDQVLNCLHISKRELADQLSAIEFMDWESVKLSLDY